jgi:hypothetical protein
LYVSIQLRHHNILLNLILFLHYPINSNRHSSSIFIIVLFFYNIKRKKKKNKKLCPPFLAMLCLSIQTMQALPFWRCSVCRYKQCKRGASPTGYSDKSHWLLQLSNKLDSKCLRIICLLPSEPKRSNEKDINSFNSKIIHYLKRNRSVPGKRSA